MRYEYRVVCEKRGEWQIQRRLATVNAGWVRFCLTDNEIDAIYICDALQTAENCE